MTASTPQSRRLTVAVGSAMISGHIDGADGASIGSDTSGRYTAGAVIGSNSMLAIRWA
jgi:hypothetical protein